MATRKKKGNSDGGNLTAPVADYRHPEATRKNNPPAKIAAEGHVPLLPKAEYSYSPRLAPVLRFDPTGSADELPELLAEATRRPLNEAEAWALAEALRKHEPWLEWAGKREAKSFAVDPVALHIHERVSAQAILKVAAREDVNRSLFADPEQEYNEAVQFYKHDVDWSNRLILGDSLQVMSSLARREDLAGKVQMIYIDPPYGIKFASNFQPEIGKRDVKDKETDLTREPEMVKAYRDTWRLGIHSYLSYLRDRLIVARELLADTGSVFVQISDENLHVIERCMLMTTDPGDLVLDPTCGSGTTALRRRAVGAALDHDRHEPRGDRHRPAAAAHRQVRVLQAERRIQGRRGRVPLQDGPAHHAQEHRAEHEPGPDLRQARALA
jgi:adenine-specific DNA-methyltransferase